MKQIHEYSSIAQEVSPGYPSLKVIVDCACICAMLNYFDERKRNVKVYEYTKEANTSLYTRS